MGLSKAVVKNRVLILMIALILLVPAVFGMLGTRINYDMLDYLPSDMDTVIGQETLKEDFGKGAFSFIVVQGMPVQEVAQLKEKIQQVDHVESVLWYDSVADLSIPMELLPDKLYNEFNTDDATMLAVFFDSATSEDVTMDAIREIRSIAGKQCFVSGMSALVTDLKDLCEQEEPIYVALAVACACAAMMLLLDGWLVPFVFLASIGMAIVYNLGSNFFLGEISYITKALSAVLQLAVTMDYSIFLWHSYNEQLTLQSDHKEAMAVAIHNTFTSVIGSSATTIAGFIALCFMSFTLGRDLGIVMAKGVLLGVLGCVAILPSLILVLDKPLQRTRHKSLIPDMGGFAKGVCKIFPVFLVIFALLVAPAYISYDKTNDEVYYDMGQCLPEDMEYVIANKKLSEEFDIASTHMLLVNADLPDSDVRAMIDEMEQVPGVKYVLGMESVVGPMIPIHYTLDGKTVTPSELAGKSGKVTIRFEYENNQYEVRTVNGVSQKVYVPFVALTGALLDTSHFSNVTVSNGKLINDGDRIAVMGMAFPGLQEDLGISKEQLDLPDYVEISADVTDFTLETTLTVVSNSLLNEVDTDDLTSGDLGSLSDSLSKLTDAMDQLMDGSSQLYDGLCTLLDSCGQLSDGVDQLTDGLDQLSSNSSALNAGAKQVFTSLLAMADEQLQPQLAQAGITIPSLTIDNYTTVLGGVLAQLDEAGTLAEQAAREQVTAAVEAARDQIRAAVTEAVQQQVTAQVTEQVRQQVLGQVLNAMGYTMEQYQQSPELKAQVDAAVELQMQTPAMQQTISENVTALMGTEEIRQKIDAATEQQVQLKIEETMASDEVQQKIMAATEQASAGAVQIRSLKQQLDQYNVFYMGLNSYTAGVDQAAAGARQLQSNMPALLDGVKQLRDGAMQLSDGPAA